MVDPGEDPKQVGGETVAARGVNWSYNPPGRESADLLAAGLFTGGFTQVASGDAFALSWLALEGMRSGFVVPATTAAALARS